MGTTLGQLAAHLVPRALKFEAAHGGAEKPEELIFQIQQAIHVTRQQIRLAFDLRKSVLESIRTMGDHPRKKVPAVGNPDIIAGFPEGLDSTYILGDKQVADYMHAQRQKFERLEAEAAKFIEDKMDRRLSS